MPQENLDKFVRISRKILKDVRVICEIGARDCVETLAFHEHFPNADIYAFECNPDTLPKCRENVEGISKISLVEKAVTDKTGVSSFYKIDTASTVTAWADGNPGASSLLKASGKYDSVEQYRQIEIKVNTVSLADFLREAKLPFVDLLWMDIQGAELSALRGAGERLRDISLVHTEVEFLEIYKNQPLFPEIRRFFKENGFKLLTFSSCGKYSGDAVFANKKILAGRFVLPDFLIILYFKFFRRIIRKIFSI